MDTVQEKKFVACKMGMKTDLVGKIEKDNNLMGVMGIYKMFVQSNIHVVDKLLEVDKLGGRLVDKMVPMRETSVGSRRNSTMRILRLDTYSCILLQLVQESSNQRLSVKLR